MVNLFPEEHFIAHLLLAKIYPKEKGLLYALRLMINGEGTKDQNRKTKINQRSYGWVKRKYSKLMSKEMKGSGNHFFGKKHSQESLRKIGEASKGRVKTKETRKLISKNSAGMGNGMASIIKIYNDGDELEHTIKGRFIPFCKENNLPMTAFQDSYRNNGKKLYQTSQGLGKAKQRGYEKYIGWYAVKILLNKKCINKRKLRN